MKKVLVASFVMTMVLAFAGFGSLPQSTDFERNEEKGYAVYRYPGNDARVKMAQREMTPGVMLLVYGNGLETKEDQLVGKFQLWEISNNEKFQSCRDLQVWADGEPIPLTSFNYFASWDGPYLEQMSASMTQAQFNKIAFASKVQWKACNTKSGTVPQWQLEAWRALISRAGICSHTNARCFFD